MKPNIVHLTMVLLAGALSACGGGGGSSTATAAASASTSTCSVTPAPTSIAVTPTTSTLIKGASQQFAVTATYADGKKAALATGLTWSTIDSTILKTFTSGSVEGLAVGVGTVTASVCGLSGNAQVIVNGPYAAISAGGSHSLARKLDGTLFSWGLNLYGQLGIGNRNDKASPTQEKNLTAKWSGVSSGEFHTVALDSCGSTGCSLYAWGNNQNGQLGMGTASTTASAPDYTDRNLPVKVGTVASWSVVGAGGTHTLAVRKDGTLWAWGRNSSGQLGLGTTVGATGTSVPTQVPALTVQTSTATQKKWSSVVAGYSHSLALMVDGTPYSWGANDRGQLGIGATEIDATGATVAVTRKDSPSPVTLANSNDRFQTIASGGDHVLAISSKGELFAWGANYYGQLGIESQKDTFTPIRVGLDSNWLQIAAGGVHNDVGTDVPLNGGHSLAIKSDGTLWAWGSNAYGQLGDGSTNDAWVPIQIGTDKDWIAVAAGKLFSIGLKANGTVWAWGRNVEGQLGNGESGTLATQVLKPTLLLN